MKRFRWFLILPLVAAANASGQADENKVYVLTKPEHTMEQVEAAYAQMPPVRYAPPADRWRYLPRTAALLAKDGAELREVMVGDSIVNDTSRSRWDDVLQKSYPRTKITKITCDRGGTGCCGGSQEPAAGQEIHPRPGGLTCSILGGIRAKPSGRRRLDPAS